MKEFDVTVTEALQKSVKVFAEDQEEAKKKAENQWRDGSVTLNRDDLLGVEFKANEGRELSGEEKDRSVMTVLVVSPGKYPASATIGTDLESMQQTVGGYIEAVYFSDDPVVLICNEEGKLDNLPLNRAIKDDNGDVLDIISGTFFICGTTDDDFCSLPEDLKQKYEKEFHDPETFLRLGQKIIAIPTEPRPEQDHDREKAVKTRGSGMEL
jgi:hypothetical protein